MILVKLFLVFLKVGLFAIGGAYSFLPLLEKELVQRYYWLTKEEFLDILGMVKLFPGAISIKYATYAGYKVAGVAGAIAANLGNILAPAALIFLAANLYVKYNALPQVQGAFRMIELVIFAMLIAVAFQSVNMQNLLRPFSILIIISTFCLFAFTKIDPAIIIVLAGVLGVFTK